MKTKKKLEQLLIKCLQKIAKERIVIEDDEGNNIVVTHAEALAKIVWKKALGTFRTVDLKTGKIEKHPPDASMIRLIFEAESKAAWLEKQREKGGDKVKEKTESVVEKVSRKNLQKLNQLSLAEKNGSRINN